MIRTFIALELSEEIRRELTSDLSMLKRRAPLVKWVAPENLHLTLRFLGDIKENELAEIFDALEETVAGTVPPFALEVFGFGAFPGWQHPRVVWAGCGDGAEEAISLAAAVEEACVDLGYEPERRQFRPHITLGRVKLPADADGLDDAVEKLERKNYGYFDVDAVVVYMSDLRRTGPVYSPMARIEL